ncbi:PQQ-binding-like beta-propeller repeat protein [Fontivita pretiosa]|uniref:outer membrane protein assembly factor BamB family protein n=1 Tax=Fontivita pretiosa TaxID=2989684 RepID=UPI003D17A180
MKAPAAAPSAISARSAWLVLLHVCSIVFICGSLCFAQAVNPQSLYGRDTTQGVYVRDSAVAVEKFALAERMEHLKEWDKAADVYQEILRSYSDRVVPSQVDAENKIYQYTSVTPAVQERLARWPEEGLRVYRARYETQAAELLASAGDDLGQLHRVLAHYFVTDAAKQAAMRMIELYLERGEFPAAAWTADRLLRWHPATGADRPALLYRAAMAYHLAGDRQQAAARLEELKANFPDAMGQVRGAQVMLADSLAGALAIAPHEPQSGDARLAGGEDSWPTAFGSPDRARVPQAGGFGGARLFSIELARPNFRGMSQQRVELLRQDQRDRDNGLMTGVFPVVDRGELFFHDNTRIYAVTLDSYQPLPGWAQTYDGERNGRYVTSGWPTPRCQQCTLTVTDDSVLAVMGLPDFITMQYTGSYGQRDTRLVCLDRRTGRQRWLVQPRMLPESAANLRNLDFFGSPLVIGKTAYIQARGGKGVQFEDSYVLAFNADDGAFKWACYIASANTNAQFWDADLSSLLGQNVSHLAYSSGRLYAATNLGAVACIDAYDGTIVWLNIYPRNVPEPNRAFGFGGGWNRARAMASGVGGEKPWTYNPVVVSQGKVFVLPSDGLHLHIYDAGSGVEVKRIRLSLFDNADTMLGVVGEKLIINNARQVFCIDWVHYDPAKKRDDNLLWYNSFQRAGAPEDSIRGRGFVTTDSVIIPTAWQLMRLTLNSGKIVAKYPAASGGAWGQDEGPGNVLVAQDRLIVAGPSRVTVYTDLALAMSKLDAEVAAAPDDPAPRLRYADMLFVAGKLEEAIAKLDEAIALISQGHGGTMFGGAARDKVFTTALGFAQKLAKEAQQTPAVADLAAGLFDRAAVAATTPSQQVTYRLSRAAFARQRAQHDLEVKLHQQILSDPLLREVPVADEDGDAVAAAVLARRAIDQAIQRAGPAVYEPYERAAAERLRAAESAIDPQQLQEVAAMYPNSSAAPRALLAAAEAFEVNKDPRRATQVLRQAYFRYPEYPQRARIIEALARNSLAMPNRIDVAIARLTLGAQKLGGTPRLSRPLPLPDGTAIQPNVSFADAADQLRKYLARSSAGDLPQIGLPPRSRTSFLPESPESIVPGVSALLVPPAEFARHDRVITYTPGIGVRVFAVGQTQPIITCAEFTELAKGAAWIERHNLLVWGQTEMMLFAGDSGQLLWKTSLKSIPQVLVVAQGSAQSAEEADLDADAPANAPQVAEPQEIVIDAGNLAQQQIIIRRNQQLIIRARRGRFGPVAVAQAALEMPPQPASEQIAQVRPLADRIVVGTTDGRIAAFDLDGGRLLWQTRLGQRAARNLLANDDFVVAHLLEAAGGAVSVQVVVLDAFSGQVLSRRSFGTDTDVAMAGADPVAMLPVNIALSPDGILVCLLADRICGKDLFEPGGLEQWTYMGERRRSDLGAPYQFSTEPDHLQISGERVLVVADNGTSLHGYSLRSGKPLPFNQQTLQFESRTSTGRLVLRTAGSRLYLALANDMKGYDLDNGTAWVSRFDARTSLRVRDVIIARDYVIGLMDLMPRGPRLPPLAQPQPQDQSPTPIVHIKAFSRAINPNGSESGLLEHDVKISDPATILSWQVVDGGFYYLSGDQKLHFRQSAGRP